MIPNSKWFPWSSRINFIPFIIFKGPLFHKPITGQELFFAVSYSKPALASLCAGIKEAWIMFLNYICTVDYRHLWHHSCYYTKHAISQFVYTCCDYESNWEGSWLCFVVVCMCVAPNVLFNRRCQSGILLCGCAQQSSSETHWGIFQLFNLIFTIWKFQFM